MEEWSLCVSCCRRPRWSNTATYKVDEVARWACCSWGSLMMKSGAVWPAASIPSPFICAPLFWLFFLSGEALNTLTNPFLLFSTEGRCGSEGHVQFFLLLFLKTKTYPRNYSLQVETQTHVFTELLGSLSADEFFPRISERIQISSCQRQRGSHWQSLGWFWRASHQISVSFFIQMSENSKYSNSQIFALITWVFVGVTLELHWFMFNHIRQRFLSNSPEIVFSCVRWFKSTPRQHGCAVTVIILSLSHLCLNKDVLDPLPDCQRHIFNHQTVIFIKDGRLNQCWPLNERHVCWILAAHHVLSGLFIYLLCRCSSQKNLTFDVCITERHVRIFETRSLKHDLWSHSDTVTFSDSRIILLLQH